MESPHRRSLQILLAGIFGIGSLSAQDPLLNPVSPKTMPPKASNPVTVTVSPLSGTPLPPTGVPVGTPIPVGIPAGTPVKSFSPSSEPIGNGIPISTNEPVMIPAAPSPYFGFYPTQWRTFPDSAYPTNFSPGISSPSMGISSSPPVPLLKSPTTTTPIQAPLVVQPPTKVIVPSVYDTIPPKRVVEDPGTLPPLLPVSDLTGPEMPGPVTPSIRPASLGKPRLTSSPDPSVVQVPTPAPEIVEPTSPAIVQTAAVEIPFVPAETKPLLNATIPPTGVPIDSKPPLSVTIPPTGVPVSSPVTELKGPVFPSSVSDSTLKVRHPVPAQRVQFGQDQTVRPAWPVLQPNAGNK